LCRNAFKNPRRADGSPPLPSEYCDAELARDGGTCDDDDAAADNGGAFFARGMITGRSGEAGSTELRKGDLVACGKGAEDGADGPGGVGGAAPVGRGGTTVETGGGCVGSRQRGVGF